jgi:hypothetical protein
MPFQSGAAWSASGGNRKGRPCKGHAIADLLRTELARPSTAGQTRGQRVAEVVVGLALGGNLDAAKWIADRTDGPLPRPATLPPDGLGLLRDGALTVDHQHTHHLELPDDTVAAVFAYLAQRQRVLGGGG